MIGERDDGKEYGDPTPIDYFIRCTDEICGESE
jgi:hypothetical protein